MGNRMHLAFDSSYNTISINFSSFFIIGFRSPNSARTILSVGVAFIHFTQMCVWIKMKRDIQISSFKFDRQNGIIYVWIRVDLESVLTLWFISFGMRVNQLYRLHSFITHEFINFMRGRERKNAPPNKLFGGLSRRIYCLQLNFHFVRK